MLPYFLTDYANPHGITHKPGIVASNAVEEARYELSQAIGCETSEIVFTSGATEANNLVIQGVGGYSRANREGVVTQATEHSSILEPVKFLKELGRTVQIVGVGRSGLVSIEEIKRLVRESFRLMSIQLVNNETGVVQPIKEITEICHRNNVLVHCDCAQAVGRLSVNVRDLGVDFASFSGHKMYGPKGIGALYVSRGFIRELRPILYGGGQERGFRPGTVPVPLCVGMAKAASLCVNELEQFTTKSSRFIQRILEELDRINVAFKVNGSLEHVAPGCLNITLPEFSAEGLMNVWFDLAFSTGSACESVKTQYSHVLRAMGISKSLASRTFRMSIGRFTNEDDIRTVLNAISRLDT